MSKTSSLTISADGETAIEERPAPKILIVEYKSILRQLILKTSTRAGYEVEGVQDGEAGWQTIHDDDYHLLIKENDMPRLTGSKLVNTTRPEYSTLPVILASGSLPTNASVLNLCALLPKPFSTRQFVDIVRRVFRDGGRILEPAAPTNSGNNRKGSHPTRSPRTRNPSAYEN